MKRILVAIIALSGALPALSQSDSTVQSDKPDTIKVGGMIIVKKHGKNDEDKDHREVIISNERLRQNISTNWWIVDLGFTNYADNTDYSSAAAQAFAPGGTKDRFDLRSGKSVNVNIWIFMQRVNLIKHAVNLKYGLGLELNNYRFDDETVRINKNPTLITFDEKDVRKNKLAADYITAPFMLNFNFTPTRSKSYGFSAGISAGYLYSARQKINHSKTHGNFDLEKWKLSYVGELNLGFVKFYGSYAFKSMWSKGLDQTPYSVGIRLSGW
jgi:hypothetical protein